MSNYQTPGVYVEEVSTGAKPIGMVGTSTAAFLGAAPRAGAHVGKPRPCHNWSQFVADYAEADSTSNDLAVAVQGFFLNGGGRCFIVNTGTEADLAGGLEALEAFDEIAIVCAPGQGDAAAYEAVLIHCEKLGDRVAILDFPADAEDLEALKKVASASGGGSGFRPRSSEDGYGAVYFPHLIVRDPFDPSRTLDAAPSGHIAGIYARTDAKRGVHKPPANETVRGALGLKKLVSRAEQGELNKAGVNVIRFFPTSGIRVWGARTLADEASEWRYINVRRLVNMIKESIEEGTRWTVFEPNDMTLWKSVERNVRAFLTLLWRQGALLGETPEQAFFVRCDDETNTPESIDAGRLITEIGIAPVKPAEFIVFRLGMIRPDEDQG
ncbi:Putative prophage major tail sheath protein [Defluviimonas aquaemixtae]|uniref:Prophage major tail sheath protein n=1 Tax=Albidovulum aquaemixtae TaxID=1542388 RepID=A0A2R8BLT8_9RHOB|nr:phage tail sheath C-terminal domain-containing protein [Defluviimonas aquaemixtae]SPH24303.1 Putative prophage major tail sheath protein [Defluviimonas aquaemixtae]